MGELSQVCRESQRVNSPRPRGDDGCERLQREKVAKGGWEEKRRIGCQGVVGGGGGGRKEGANDRESHELFFRGTRSLSIVFFLSSPSFPLITMNCSHNKIKTHIFDYLTIIESYSNWRCSDFMSSDPVLLILKQGANDRYTQPSQHFLPLDHSRKFCNFTDTWQFSHSGAH